MLRLANTSGTLLPCVSSGGDVVHFGHVLITDYRIG